jgi:hypothetical protein
MYSISWHQIDSVLLLTTPNFNRTLLFSKQEASAQEEILPHPLPSTAGIPFLVPEFH